MVNDLGGYTRGPALEIELGSNELGRFAHPATAVVESVASERATTEHDFSWTGRSDDQGMSPRAVKPRSSWTRVADAKTWPFRANGWLGTKTGNGVRYGSGTIVLGSRHVLTAAHNLFTPGVGWCTESVFMPARQDQNMPYGTFTGVKCAICPDYARNPSTETDWGIVILDRSPGIKPLCIANMTDWGFGNCELSIAGYPHRNDPPPTPPNVITDELGRQMWTDHGRATGWHPNRVDHTLDIWIGHSGAALWYVNADNRREYAVAVQSTHTPPSAPTVNHATRLGDAWFDMIVKWIQNNP